MHTINKLALTCLGLAPALGLAQIPFSQDISVPPTTRIVKGEKEKTIHTQHLEFVGEWQHRGLDGIVPMASIGAGALINPPGMHPADISGIYQIQQYQGAGAIAVVEAYDYPTALNDYNVFSHQYFLPGETSTAVTASTNTELQVVYAPGTRPAYDPNWAGEAALDIEWTHAMAPYAKIYLVECASDSFDDIVQGIKVANKLPGVREICMSFGALDFPSEKTYDSLFTTPNVAYFAAAGDSPGSTFYPATSPNVVGVGGTSFSQGFETAWSYGGGGISNYEPMPAYQKVISLAGWEPNRASPDMAADADPSTGLSVYDSAPDQFRSTGWLVYGGTSAAAAIVTGITNARGYKATSSVQELNRQYAAYANGNYNSIFNDIMSGGNATYQAGPGYDLVTGLGSPLGMYQPQYDVEQDPVSVQLDPTATTLLSGNLGSLQGVDMDFYWLQSALVGKVQEAGIVTTFSPTYPSPIYGAGTSSFYFLITATASQDGVPVTVYLYNYQTHKYDLLSTIEYGTGWEAAFTPSVSAAPYLSPKGQITVFTVSAVSQSNPFQIGYDQIAMYSNSSYAP